MLTSKLVAPDASGSRRDADYLSLASLASGRSFQPFPKSMVVDPHLVSLVTTLTDLVSRDYLREEGLDRADTMGFLHALLRFLSRVALLALLALIILPCHLT